MYDYFNLDIRLDITFYHLTLSIYACERNLFRNRKTSYYGLPSAELFDL